MAVLQVHAEWMQIFYRYELSECLPYIIFQVQSLHKFLKLFDKNDDGWSFFNGSVKKSIFLCTVQDNFYTEFTA